MRIFLTFLIFFSIKSLSEPWLYLDDLKLSNLMIEVNKNCNFYLQLDHSSPTSIYKLKELSAKIANNENENCRVLSYDINRLIESKFFQSNNYIGFQTDIDDFFLQDRGYRYYGSKNLYFSHSNVEGDFAYKIKVTKVDKDIIFDESYFSYKFNKNLYLKVGKYNKWWSPSNNTSLILSNAARPMPIIEISNYEKINLNKGLFKLLGNLNYEVFLSKFERNREIPNAVLFGNRISLNPHERLKISLLRVAQFGGKGRVVNSSTIKNMILGKDTTNRNLNFEDQPGNQIAGIDFSYRIINTNNLYLYGQYLGEDGLDPIIDDRWVGAIFPSKRFGLIGTSFNQKIKNNIYKFTIEHINTDTGFNNVTYNHGLYKTGYRYKGLPIGANIDGDSHKSLISIETNFHNNYLKIKYHKSDINQNNSNRNSFSDKRFLVEGFSIKLIRQLNINSKIDIVLSSRRLKDAKFKDNVFFIKYEYRL